MTTKYTVPGIQPEQARKLVDELQHRLTALIDLHLTLKHVHWNVVGPAFIGVHRMLDPQVDAVRLMSDDVAERIATLGFEPIGTPGFVAKNRSWDDYSIGRASTQEHLAALDVVYSGLIGDHRRCIGEFEELDVVTQDMLISQTQELERYQWFVRAHLEDSAGRMPHRPEDSEREAAEAAADASAGSP
ncbi:MAG TPA: DNA starvation/stationary phase protection protein [Egibacteraceae bacterium]|nr:DNA starvation/stationary phase protection protein [Egibacteraceae bacterium]